MKRLLSWLGVAALAATFAPALLAQPVPLVKVTDSGDPNLVLPASSGTYVISEYYCANDSHTNGYSVNGLAFTNNIGRVPGTTGTGNLGTPMFTGVDATNLWTISEGEQWAKNIDFTLPTTAGHSYVLELLFHDNYYSVNGKRIFTVLAGPAGYPTNVLAANLDLNAQGAGANTAADILLRFVLNDSDGSGIEVKLSASADNALICASALLDVTGVAPQVFVGPVSQTSYPDFQASFPCVIAGSAISYAWQTDTSGSFANLSDGANVSGSTTRTLTLTHLTTANQGDYQVVATNPNGTAASIPAYLTISPASGLSVFSSPTDPSFILTNAMLFAEYYGSDFGPLTIGGVTFRNNNARIGGNTATQNLPYFGSSQDDTNLALLSENDQWAPNGGTFDLVLPTLAGRSYVLQLLMHDNAFATANTRIFEINAGPQGSLTNLVQDFDLAYMGAYTTNPVDVLVTLPVNNSDGTPLEIQLVAGSKDNPLLDAMTFQDVSGAPVPPMIVGQPASTNVFAGRTLSLSVQAVGAPLNYQWQSSPPNAGTFSPLSDGGPYSGSATANLTISNITAAQALDYRVVVSNGAGSTNSSVANVNVLTPPSFTPGQNYGSAILYSNNAVDYWRLNEPYGSPSVYDNGPGAKDGLTGSSLPLGTPGPSSPDYPGFGAGNTGIETSGGSPSDYITTPALNLNTNTVTLLAWLNPTAQQQPGAGILLSRLGTSGTFNSGLTYGITLQSNLDYSLRYFWNGASVDSGLRVPQNLWSLVGLVVTSNSAAVYVVNTNGLFSWSQSGTFAPCPFSNPFLVGNDTADGGTGTRTFTGYLDEVAVFNHALSSGQILGLFTNATGVAAVPPTVTAATPAISTVNPGATVTLSATPGGVPAPAMQWQKRAIGSTGAFVNIANATNNTLTLNSVTAASSGDYLLMVSNKVGTVTSTPARVLVAQANPPALVGEWLTGNANLGEVSGYNPAGLHDGLFYGSGGTWNAGDVPPGFSGSSLHLDGATAVIITNTLQTDSDYRITFDNNATNRFSVAFWAKGFPTGNWSPFVGKRCETDSSVPHGFAVRHNNNSTNIPTFSLVGTASGNNDAGSGGSIGITDSNWHHYAATYDSTAGVRHLYVDGVDVLNTSRDFGGWGPANGYHMIFGAEDQNPSAPNRYFTGSLFDVRFYNYALAQAEVQAIQNPAAAGAVALYLDTTAHIPLGQPEGFTVLIPAGANVAGPVTVWVTNNAPSVAVIRGGAYGPVFTVTFAQNAPVTQSFILDTVGVGTISLALGNNAGLTSLPVTGATVVPPQIIGHWLTGAQSLADAANFAGPGVHDGVASAGTGIGTSTALWTNDAPPGYTGSALLLNGTYAVTIGSSSTLGGSYQPTFDADLAEAFSVSFWAKGIPGSNIPWISKSGATANYPGWEIREYGANNVPTFTLRTTANSVNNADPADAINSVTSLNGFNTNWHHFTATWDSLSGTRKLYVDGQLSLTVPNDAGPLQSPSFAYLTLGGLDSALPSQKPPATSIGSYLPANSELFDVRVYNYALSAGEVKTVMQPSATAFAAAADTAIIDQGHTGTISFALPAGVNTNQAFTAWVTNLTPGIVSIAGASQNPFSVTFPAGTLPALRFTLNGLSQGQGRVVIAANGYTPATATVQVYAPQLVGHWLYGLQNLKEVSGFMPAHTHDGGAEKTATPATALYSSTVPPGFSGSSLSLDGTYAVIVTNSDAATGVDPNYQSTFDDVIANRFSVTFWENCATWNNTWVGFVGKLGDQGSGFQLHRNNGANQEDFVVRDTATHVSDMYGTSGQVVNGTWHHIALVYDGYAGTRQEYVDGVLVPTINQTGDYGPYTLARNHHLTIGSEESVTALFPPQVGNNSYTKGLMYDLRVYNYALGQPQIQAVMTPAAPPLTLQPSGNGNLVLSWPSWANGYTLQTTTSLNPPAWVDSGLPVTTSQNVSSATDTAGTGTKFYRLYLH